MLGELLPGHCERLFERYRSRGDAAALGALFDRTAPELAALAARLAPSRAEAQDLLQATFLAAMESAASFEPGRRLMPWLVGILVKEARLARRRAGRAVDPERLAQPRDDDPLGAAAARELQQAVADLLADVPETYRAVLALHLGADKTPAEIARELGRSRGAVRVQLHRGLARLRRALPAGFAAAGALAVLTPRSLGEVRAQVLARAPGAGVPLGAGPLVAAGVAGGTLVKKALLVGLGMLFVGAALWLRRGSGERGEPEVARPVRPVAVLEPAQQVEQEPERAEARREPRVADPEPRASSQPARETGAGTTGIRGRLVEADGRPVADLPVELVGLPAELLVVDAAGALSGAAGEAGLVRSSTRSDAEGRFVLAGSDRRGLHGLGIDPGGPRAGLRVLEQALVAGEEADLGDVVLAAAGTLVGRVVDEAGQPLAGVRVRAASLPEAVLELGLHRWRPESLLAARAGRTGSLAVLDPPGWVRALAEHLPIPSTTSAADGSFALRPPLGVELTLVADDARHEPLVRTGLRVFDGTQDLGTLVLRPARRVTCRVRDAEGRALVEAEVFAGAVGGRGAVAVLARAEAAGEPGLHGAPVGEGAVLLAARVGEGPWHVTGPLQGDGVHELVLPAPRALTLDVRDEQGRGVSGLTVAVQALEGRPKEDETAFLAPPRPAGSALRTLDATSFVLDGLADGRHRLFARAEGCGMLVQEILVGAETPPVRLVLAPETGLVVRVLDEASGAPLAGASVRLRCGRQGRFTRLFEASTDAEGRAQLALARPAGRDELQVQAELAGHARAGATLAAQEIGAELTLRLARPAAVEGTVLEGGQPVRRPLLVALRSAEGALADPGNLPYLALTDAGGRFRLAGLPPGAYLYQVGERFLDGDPLTSLLGGRLGEFFDLDKGILEKRLQQGGLGLAGGEVARLEIELAPSTEGDAAFLRGRIVQDGRGWPGLELELDGERSETVRTSDAGGAFDFGRVAAGAARLKVEDVLRGTTILRAELELRPGERRELELVFEPMSVDVTVLGPDGPLASAELEFVPASRLYERTPSRARTNAQGLARVELPGCGTFDWTVRAGALEARGWLGVLSGEPLTLRVRPLVVLRAPLELAPELVGEARAALLSVRSLGEGPAAAPSLSALDPSAGRLELHLDGAGRYELTAYCDRRWSRPIVLEVPAGGLESGLLRFELGP